MVYGFVQRDAESDIEFLQRTADFDSSIKTIFRALQCCHPAICVTKTLEFYPQLFYFSITKSQFYDASCKFAKI
jgi:hypothetical protein